MTALVSSPLVSIITIFLNPGDFLKAAVESVLAQTSSDYELLLVDDGSTDGSTEAARTFAARYADHVRYLEHPNHANQGMSASRNLGLAHARGQLIAYIDADDVWMPQKLAEQIALFESHPEVHMSYGPVVLWRSWNGAPSEQDGEQSLGVELDRVYQPPSLLPVFLQCTECTPAPTATMVRRDTLVALGGNEESFRTMYEDQVLFSKVAAAYPVWVSSRPSSKMRMHEHSCCAVALRDRTHLQDRRHFLLWLEKYLTRHNIDDDTVTAAWQMEWERYFGLKARFKDCARPFVPRRIRSWLKAAGYT